MGVSAQVCVRAPQVDNKSSVWFFPHISVSYIYFPKWHQSPANPCKVVMTPLLKKKKRPQKKTAAVVWC